MQKNTYLSIDRCNQNKSIHFIRKSNQIYIGISESFNLSEMFVLFITASCRVQINNNKSTG